MEYNPCLLCGSPDAQFIWEKEGARYVRCKTCTLIYENPRLDPEELKKFYSDESYFVGSPDQKATSGYVDYFSQCNSGLVHTHFEILRRATGFGPGTRFLDVGSGPGNLMEHANQHGWKSSGVELSSWAADLGKKRGLDIFEGTLEQAKFADSTFDLVTMFDVIEHLPDPHAVIREVHRVLKPGGWFIGETPNIEGFFVQHLYHEQSEMVKPRAHICMYGPATVKRLFLSEHFADVKVKTFPYCRKFTPGYIKSLIVTRLTPKAVHRQFTINEALRIFVRK
jgi:2-polyprenyl-3-methyl-5-hydroxy-6-metoxy-1,4-benzoquinol methylase